MVIIVNIEYKESKREIILKFANRTYFFDRIILGNQSVSVVCKYDPIGSCLLCCV